MMGGGIKGRGNVMPTAEFNIFRDPESAYIILNSLISSITILPLDVDENLHISLVCIIHIHLTKAEKNVAHKCVYF